MSQSSIRIAGYAALVFVTSDLVLVVEMVAARLIAPFVGISLYSWTAIIGVILAGLPLGNWLGGVWGQATKGLLAQGIQMSEVPLITDELAPVERLMAGLFLSESGRCMER